MLSQLRAPLVIRRFHCTTFTRSPPCQNKAIPMEQTPGAARPTNLFYAIESTAKRAEPERSIAQLADQCSTRPLTKSRLFQRQPHHWQAAHPNSSSKAHEILLTKMIMHVSTIHIHVELRMASLRQCAFNLKPSVLKLFVLKPLASKIRHC